VRFEVDINRKASAMRLRLIAIAAVLSSSSLACTNAEKKVISSSAQAICVVGAAAANALVGWVGGQLPQGLDSACEGALTKWANGGPSLNLQVDNGPGRTLDYYLPKIDLAATPDSLPPSLQALLDKISADMQTQAGSG
jgi:hypothetical protein